jgi:hypothetical protein
MYVFKQTVVYPDNSTPTQIHNSRLQYNRRVSSIILNHNPAKNHSKENWEKRKRKKLVDDSIYCATANQLIYQLQLRRRSEDWTRTRDREGGKMNEIVSSARDGPSSGHQAGAARDSTSDLTGSGAANCARDVHGAVTGTFHGCHSPPSRLSSPLLLARACSAYPSSARLCSPSWPATALRRRVCTRMSRRKFSALRFM